MATNTINKDGLAPEVLAYIDSLESENSTLASTLDEATDTLTKANTRIEELESSESEETEGDEDVLKSADPKLVALVKSLQEDKAASEAKLSDALAIAKGERDQRVEKEFISKAADFKVATDATALGKALKDISENCSEDSYKTVEAVLKAAGEQVEKGALFEESGSRGSDSTPKANDAIDTAAKALIEKGEAKTYSEAVAKAVKNDPSLYERHVEGN